MLDYSRRCDIVLEESPSDRPGPAQKNLNLQVNVFRKTENFTKTLVAGFRIQIDWRTLRTLISHSLNIWLMCVLKMETYFYFWFIRSLLTQPNAFIHHPIILLVTGLKTYSVFCNILLCRLFSRLWTTIHHYGNRNSLSYFLSASALIYMSRYLYKDKFSIVRVE
jgi:hypothetical protein